ncbi:hypothetical protein ANN_16944 [Periplaneta americana]|uniref:Uncharacterized protein n=1 Tax=Periplaneta americana TaxID=6978 RepID=A0ABQ8SRI8_PERAM|nr:hypothetical protein ANN_16944 [Periplaneta americana]
MSPGSSTESYPAIAHIGLRENPGKNLNQISHRCLIDLRTRSQTPGVLRMSSEHATIRFRRDSKSGTGDTPLINRQHIHFLHDGAPAHFSRTARRYLDRRFPDRRIGRGGPIAWPPCSPDLNPLDFYLWFI